MRVLLSLSILTLSALAALGQSDSSHLIAINNKLEKYASGHPIEKAYIQTNKPAYTTGDTIWLKGYTTAGPYHQPSALSGVLYAELIDEKGKVVRSLTLKSNNGLSAGDMALDSKMTAGTYHLRAYTQWMKNEGPGYFFDKPIKIEDTKTIELKVGYMPVPETSHGTTQTATLSYTDKQGRPYAQRQVSYTVKADTNTLYRGTGITDNKGQLTITYDGTTAKGQLVRISSKLELSKGTELENILPVNIANNTIDIQFFPEGGELVNDVRSRIAFKATGTNGLGVDITGTITDMEGNEVADINTQHAGMGVFALTPRPGVTYIAKVSYANNANTIDIPLPKAADKGFVLAVNTSPNDSTKLNIRISTNEQTLSERKGQPFYIAGQNNQKVYYATAGKLDDNNLSYTATVAKDRFPSGIAQFTLFSKDNEPMNERITFIQNKADQLKLNISTNKQQYQGKDKTELNITAKDNKNKPVQGSFSVTVYNEDGTEKDDNNENTILTSLLLTSDLKGYIEQPNYYFGQTNTQTQGELDNLMLTQGYRRFVWTDIINNQQTPIAYMPEKGLTLSGTLTAGKNKPVANGKISLLSVADNQAGNGTTDAQGRFTLYNLSLSDPANVIIKAQTDKGDNRVNIKLDSKSYPLITKTDLMPITYAQEKQMITTQAYTKAADTAQIKEEIKEQISASKKISREHELNEVNIKERRNAGTEIAPWVIVNPHSSNLNGPGHADMTITAKQLENCATIGDCLQARIPGIDVKPPPYGTAYFIRHENQSIMHPPPITFIVDGTVLLGHSLLELDESLIAGTVETIEVLKSGSYLSVYGTTAPGGALIITTKVGTEDIYGTPEDKEAEPGILTTKVGGYAKAREFYVPKYTSTKQNITDNRTAVY